MTSYAAITFTAEGTGGKQRVQRAVVGRMFRDRQVLAIGGEDPITILQYGGHMLQVPAGSVLKVEFDRAGPPPKRVAVPPKLEAQQPVGLCFVHAITYSDGIRQRTVSVGDEMAGKRVASIGLGDPATVRLSDGSVALQIASGSISRWA